MPESELLTVREAAAFLRVSLPTVYKMVHGGLLPHVLIGCRIVIPKDALRSWVNAQTSGGVLPDA